MEDQVRTQVTFDAIGFNTTEDLEEFINPCNYGKDVAEWFVCGLQEIGLVVDPEVGQEDCCWYLTFTGQSGTAYNLLIGWHGDGYWMGWIERSVGFWKFIFESGKKKIVREDVLVIDQMLKNSDSISNVKWHFEDDFQKGIHDNFSNSP